MNTPILIQKGFAVGYNKKAILTIDGDIKFEKGETTILVGNNGSGKSTFLKTICGQILPITGMTPGCQAVYLPEELEFPSFLTARDIIKTSLAGSNVYLEAAITMGVPLDKPVSQLSKGNRQKLRVVYAEGFAHLLGADILCLDEPFSGMDTISRRLLTDIWNGKRHVGAVFSKTHRIITMHTGDAPINTQTLIAANGGIHILPSIGFCDKWIEIAVASGIDISDF